MLRKEFFLFWGIFLLGAFLRLWRFWDRSLWLDELVSYWSASGDGWLSVITRTVCCHNHSPFHHGLLKLFITFFGTSETTLRLPSLILSILIMHQLFRLGRNLFSFRTGCFAMLVLALAEPHVFQAQNARQYSLGMFFFLLAMSAFFRWQEAHRQKAKWWFVLWATLTLYAHYTYIVLLAALIPYFLVGKVRWAVPDHRGRNIDLFIMIILPVVLLLPMHEQIQSFIERREMLDWVDSYTWKPLIQVFELRALLLGLLGLAIISLPSLSKRPGWVRIEPEIRSKLLQVAVWSVVPFVVLALISLGLDAPTLLLLRHTLIYSLPYYLIIGFFMHQLKSPVLKLAFFIPYIVMVALPTVGNLIVHGRASAQGISGWKEAAMHLKEEAKEDDLVLLFSGLAEMRTFENVDDPLFFEYLASPLGDFYLKVPLNVVVLGFPWEKGKERYYQDTVLKELRAVDHFWLVARRSGKYVDKFEEWLKEVLGKPVERIRRSQFPLVELREYKVLPYGA